MKSSELVSGTFFLTIVWTIEAISEAVSAQKFASISTVIDLAVKRTILL